MFNSVQQFVKSNLDGLLSPQLQPLQAVIMPPIDVSAAGAPICYIWGAEHNVRRFTMPRPLGLQKFNWTIDCSLIAAADIEDPNNESAFPLLLDQIMATMGTIKMPVTYTDPQTGFKSQLMNLGEEWSGRYARLRVPGKGGAGLIKFGADFSFKLDEDVSYISGYPNAG